MKRKAARFIFSGIAIVLVVMMIMPQASVYAGTEHTVIPVIGNTEDEISIADLESEREAVWAAYKTARLSDATLISDTTYDSESVCTLVQDEDTLMKCYVTVKGEKPAGGYPLYIALHGGGGNANPRPNTNDSQWDQMKSYYSEFLDCGVYVATRVVDGNKDEWNLHFRNDAYPLYDRLIENLILTKDVDPNRVYIEGFSAGGDGVYAITARMADRFAAANMSAGHPNGINMVNHMNLPIQLQVGENDASYSRNYWVPRYNILLNELNEKYGGYEHRALVHWNHGHNFPDDVSEEERINRAYGAYAYWQYCVIYGLDSAGNNTLEFWKNRYDYYNDAIMTDPSAWLSARLAGSSYSDMYNVDYYPPTWLSGFTRDPLPTKINWNLGNGTRRETRSVDSFYWLSAPMSLQQGIISASYDKSSNKICIDTEDIDNASYSESEEKVVWTSETMEDHGDVSVLLNEKMVDFSKPVTFDINGKEYTVKVIPQRSVLEETTAERGDPNFQFEAKVKLSEIESMCYHSLTKIEAKNATCTETGNTEYWKCTKCEKCFADDEALNEVDPAKSVSEGGVITEALGHDYELSGWNWTGSDEAGWTAAAVTFVCKNDVNHTETVTAEVSNETVDSTCQKDGVTTYTAAAVFEGETFIDKKQVGIDKKAHEWEAPEYTWEGLACTASRKCTNCDTEETETVTAAEKDSKAANCGEKGCTVYTAEFVNAAFEVQSKEVEIAATGHAWGAWTSKDETTHRRVCANDDTHIDIGEHVWNEGKVTKEPTATETGENTYTCKVCGGTKTEVIPATGSSTGNDPNTNNGTGDSSNTGASTADKTNTSAGSAAATEAAIYGMSSDTDISGSDIMTLRLRSTSQGKNSVKLAWKAAGGAVKYVVYGNRCGKANRMKKLGETSEKSLNITKIGGARLKKGTYHKFIVVAVDASGNRIAASKTIHVATKGGKYGNYSSIKISNSKKLKSIKAGKTVKIKAKARGKRVKKHVGLRYESSNPAVATVTKAGKIKAVSKGTATIFIYAQNGVSKQIKVRCS